MELDGSSNLLSVPFSFGGGGGGGGRIVLADVPGGEFDVEETIAPDGIRNSFPSVLKTIVVFCIFAQSFLQIFILHVKQLSFSSARQNEGKYVY